MGESEPRFAAAQLKRCGAVRLVGDAGDVGVGCGVECGTRSAESPADIRPERGWPRQPVSVGVGLGREEVAVRSVDDGCVVVCVSGSGLSSDLKDGGRGEGADVRGEVAFVWWGWNMGGDC